MLRILFRATLRWLRSRSPHPPFGHLLPQGEKEGVERKEAPPTLLHHPSPLVGEGARRADEGTTNEVENL
jgi:hypothetical protein